VKRVAVVFALLVVGPACEAKPPAAPEPPATFLVGAFGVRVAPNPVVFRPLYPGAHPLAVASPPPPDPRYYVAPLTLIITEQIGGTGHLDSVETELVSSEGVVTNLGSYDGACDFLTLASRTIPPRGSLSWCMGRIATPETAGPYTLRVSARITDALGNVTTATVSPTAVVQR
jgi:hypothetical protein